MPASGLLDWTRPSLRLAYLVEGVVSPMGNRYRKVVRWCGPKVRTGSGVIANRTLEDDGTPITGAGAVERTAPAGRPTGWEARLSRGTYAQSLGGWKRSVQALSDAVFTVDIGSDDNRDERWLNESDLRDLCHVGRWKGQRARLILVDLDDLDNFEIVVDGTWDRDPDDLKQGSFKMTIAAGSIIPPTLPWPMWQCPTKVPASWDSTDPPSGWNPTGYARQWPSTFAFSDSCAGKWMGPAFGGRDGETNADNWAEIVPYGYSTATSFGMVSRAKWTMVYDIFYTDADGNHEMVSEQTDRQILVFNNTAPERGPLGTCVAWHDGGVFAWRDSGARVFAKVGGTDSADQPGIYGTGENNYPWFGANRPASSTTTTGEATAFDPPGPGEAELSAILRAIFEGEDFGLFDSGIPGLHTDTIPDLYVYMTLIGQKTRRCCRIPRDLVSDPPSFLDVLSDLMQSIPGDLVLRRDPLVGFPRYYIAVRPSPAAKASHRIGIADLYRTEKWDVTIIDDPDGYYANEVDLSESRNDSGEEASGDDLGRFPQTLRDVEGLRNLAEQGPYATGQPIYASKAIKHWTHDLDGGQGAGAEFFLQAAARPQKTITATHGIQSMSMQLGEVLWYDVPSVLPWAGQIRGMRLDLDRQTVKVKSYHWPFNPEVTSVKVAGDEGSEQSAIFGVRVSRAEQDAQRGDDRREGAREPMTTRELRDLTSRNKSETED